MRKVTAITASAFVGGVETKCGNSWTMKDADGHIGYYLHGHRIANIDEKGNLWICMCGYGTATTRDRLNGIMAEWFGTISARVYQRDYMQFLSFRGRDYHIDPNGLYVFPRLPRDEASEFLYANPENAELVQMEAA